MDKFSKEKRSAIMKSVRTKNTDIEEKLNVIVKPLWSKHRYRKNVKNLPGKPDIVFPKAKLAIFADGDFWHGKDFDKWREGVPEFWKKKISSNKLRDKKQTKALKMAGFKVIRFWGSSIKKYPERVEKRVKTALYTN